MPFIVFEGIDGAGAETQAKLLVDYLRKKGKDVLYLEYPDYSSAIGKAIEAYLKGKFEINSEALSLLFIADFLKDKQKIKEARFVVANRYFTSTITYEVVLGVRLELLLSISELLDLPKPDLVVYLDISPETSIKRKLGEKAELDKHEKNLNFLAKVREQYLENAKNKVFAEWVVIDGEASIEEVYKQVLTELSSKGII